MPDLFQYRSPWIGADVSQPEVNLEPGATPFSNNFDYVLGELRTRSPFIAFPQPGTAPLFEYVRSYFSFRDINFVLRLAAVGTVKLYSYAASAYTVIGVPTGAGEFRPLIPAVYNGVMYWPTGTSISSWNGVAFVDVASAITGGKFIGELANHLVVLNTTEVGPLYFPQRVRWSASGLPTQFDPTVNTNAGYVDLDVPDAISGFVSMGTIAWIMRTDGITQMIPTGNGLNPFDFLPLLGAPVGVGNYYPWSLDSYGLQCAFVSRDDIYLGTPQGLTPIGGRAREAIYLDIGNTADVLSIASPYTDSSGTTFSTACPVVIGSIVPNTSILGNDNFSVNRSCSYILAIPKQVSVNGTPHYSTVFWKYDMRTGTWLRWENVRDGFGWLTSNIRTLLDTSVTPAQTHTVAGTILQVAI